MCVDFVDEVSRREVVQRGGGSFGGGTRGFLGRGVNTDDGVVEAGWFVYGNVAGMILWNPCRGGGSRECER